MGLFDKMWILEKICRNAINIDQDKIFYTIIQEKSVQQYVIDLNRRDQLFREGENVEGDIADLYSNITEQINKGISFTFEGESKLKIAGSPMFFFETGDFYKSFKVKIDKKGITIIANTIVDDGTDLQERYGNLIGLTDESKGKFARFILPEIIKQAKKELFKQVL